MFVYDFSESPSLKEQSKSPAARPALPKAILGYWQNSSDDDDGDE